VAFSPDGKLLASAHNSRIIGLWDVATRQLEEPVKLGQAAVSSLAFSPNGRLLAVASANVTTEANNSVILVDVPSRKQLGDLTEDQLRDIGLSRADAFVEANKPFWRA